jgi:hypothetical protein
VILVGAIGMNAFVRLLICTVVVVIAVIATAGIQNHYGAHSNPQLGGVGMVALVLTWIFTGMKSKS